MPVINETSTLLRILERERAQRKHAEHLLETKTRELSLSHESLELSQEKLALAHHELNQTQELLIELENLATVGEMTEGLVHEIKNPLAYILGNMQSMNYTTSQCKNLKQLVDDYLNSANDSDFVQHRHSVKEQIQKFDLDFLLDDSDELTNDVAIGINRITSLANSLIEYSQEDASLMVLVDINQCLGSVLQFSRFHMNMNNKIVEDYGDVPKVQAYPSKLAKALLNIIAFSGRRLGTSDTVTVATECEDNDVTVVISNTGKPISEDTFNKLFEPDFKCDGNSKRARLGLFVAKSVIDDHNGALTATNDEDSGIVFTVRLPTDVGNRWIPE